jgi:hypothetical protein
MGLNVKVGTSQRFDALAGVTDRLKRKAMETLLLKF